MRIHPETFTPDSKIFISSDGTELYAEAVGDRSKPPIVFIHAFFLSSAVFDDIFCDPAWLNDAYLVRYDLRGHGRSEKPEYEDAYESQRFAEDFNTVLEAFQLVKPFVVGWSTGATVIADILSFQQAPLEFLSGIIYVAPLPSMWSIPHMTTDVGRDLFSALVQHEDVNAYQEAANSYVYLCSMAMTHPMRLACLGSFLIQPRFVATHLLSRLQEEDGLLRAGEEAGLPLLVLLGKKDNLIVNEEIISWTAPWRDVKVVEMDADHTPWIGDSSALRREVFDWTRTAASR